MSRFWPLSQKSLHGRTLHLLDHRLDKASVFPLFDHEGSSRTLMLVTEASRDIMLADYRPGVFAKPYFGPGRLGLRRADLRDASEAEAEACTHLWHFDPWWLLGEPRYDGHVAVPPLKSTNIPGVDARIKQVWFDRSLAKVHWALLGAEPSRFDPAVLDRAARERDERVRTSGPRPAAQDQSWRLRPFWESREPRPRRP